MGFPWIGCCPVLRTHGRTHAMYAARNAKGRVQRRPLGAEITHAARSHEGTMTRSSALRYHAPAAATAAAIAPAITLHLNSRSQLRNASAVARSWLMPG